MKSTKNVLMTAIALAIALFASVQISAMSTAQKQINDLETTLKERKTKLAYYIGMRNTIQDAQSKGIKLNDEAREKLIYAMGAIFGIEEDMEQTQAKIDALKKRIPEIQKLELVLKDNKEKLAQIETNLRSHPEERPFNQKYIAERQQSIKETQAKIDALIKI